MRSWWPLLRCDGERRARPAGRRRGRRGLRRRGAAHRDRHRDQRPLALHPPRGDEGRAGDRAAPGRRPAPRGRRGRRHRDRPDRRHGGLRRGLLDGRARRAVAFVQDARAALRRDRRPADRRLRRRARDGPLRQARAADPPPGRGGLGGTLARRERGLTLTSAFELATAVTPLGDGRWAATADTDWFATTGPNGGYTAAIVLRAMAEAVDDAERLPRSLTLHYTR